MTQEFRMRRLVGAGIVLSMALLFSACGPFGASSEPEPTPTVVARAIVPTFTPTPVQAATATPEPAAPPPTQVITIAQAPAVTTTGSTTSTAAVTATGNTTATGTVTTTTAGAPTAAPTPGLKVEADVINVRTGPGTSYGLVGTATIGQKFDIKGRTDDKTWYLICCVNGQQGWVNTEFTDESNEELAPVVAAPEPVAQAPAPTQPAAAQPPAAQPAPTATPAPAPPPASDPCAGIGGDGCKFKLRGGPSFGANGGAELKLQLHFIHSGIDGGQPQGSYFVWLEKDGQKLPVSDAVRSIALQDQGGTLGKYNYEYKLAPSSLPGGTVAGNYSIWVLDGNGERDSKTFTFTVPDGQGEVWMEFDQA